MRAEAGSPENVFKRKAETTNDPVEKGYFGASVGEQAAHGPASHWYRFWTSPTQRAGVAPHLWASETEACSRTCDKWTSHKLPDTRGPLAALAMRSALAVLAGFLLIAFLSFAVDALARAALPGSFGPDGRVTSTGTLLFYVSAAVAYTIAGGYATGRLAPSRPVRHAIWLGVVGLVVGVAASLSLWSTAPAWYHVLGWVLVVPSALVGGRLAEQARSRAVAVRG